ncbi:MAG: hypothetical protein HRT87_01275 [Legionellales bacterium]|nr:hypothetical protein [Legionellales bacterium]
MKEQEEADRIIEMFGDSKRCAILHVEGIIEVLKGIGFEDGDTWEWEEVKKILENK